jgi:uncharacterized cupin superfamily protein
MDTIQVKKPTKKELQELGIDQWSSWSCEISTFDWEYTEQETAYIQEGRVTVIYPGGETEIQAGDLVTFPKGMKCVWEVHEPIKKVYKFDS